MHARTRLCNNTISFVQAASATTLYLLCFAFGDNNVTWCQNFVSHCRLDRTSCSVFASMLRENGFHKSRISTIMKEMEILKFPKADR